MEETKLGRLLLGRALEIIPLKEGEYTIRITPESWRFPHWEEFDLIIFGREVDSVFEVREVDPSTQSIRVAARNKKARQNPPSIKTPDMYQATSRYVSSYRCIFSL